jgi:pimeloyl-ACP methyl ester carboxylesterase
VPERLASVRSVRVTRRPPAVPPVVPPGYVTNLPGRGEVFYRRHEGGEPGQPTLLLLHGWTASADLQWCTAYGALAERYPFVAVDHRGHGRGLRSEQPYTLEEAADDAAALVRSLRTGPVVAVGYSMGGPIALLLAQRHPDLVRGLVLEATALEWRATRRDRAQWWFLVAFETVLRSRLARVGAHLVLQRATSGQPALEPWLPWLAAETSRGDARALTQAGRALSTFDARPFAVGLGLPAGLLLTTRDRHVRPAKQRALADAVDAEVVEVPGDHFSFWALPDAFAEATRRLVDGVVDRAAGHGTPFRAAG